MAERLVMTRLVKGRPPGRDFDIEFWQKLGPAKIFAAAWDLVVTAAAARGIGEDQLRLQRSVARLKRGRHGRWRALDDEKWSTFDEVGDKNRRLRHETRG